MQLFKIEFRVHLWQCHKVLTAFTLYHFVYRSKMVWISNIFLRSRCTVGLDKKKSTHKKSVDKWHTRNVCIAVLIALHELLGNCLDHTCDWNFYWLSSIPKSYSHCALCSIPKSGENRWFDLGCVLRHHQISSTKSHHSHYSLTNFYTSNVGEQHINCHFSTVFTKIQKEL